MYHRARNKIPQSDPPTQLRSIVRTQSWKAESVMPPNPPRHVEWQLWVSATSYFLLAGGTIPFMRRYSTIWP